nr:DUF4158 domain-containing protein [Streptomyces capoamus]
MPVEFLSDEQAGAYGTSAEQPTRPELERFFLLDDVDRDLIALRRTEHHRLGFALQMCTVRYVGLFLEDPLAVPWPVIEHLAVQLGIEDTSVAKRYTERRQTLYDHAWKIQGAYGYHPYEDTEWGRRFPAFLHGRAWAHAEGPKERCSTTPWAGRAVTGSYCPGYPCWPGRWRRRGRSRRELPATVKFNGADPRRRRRTPARPPAGTDGLRAAEAKGNKGGRRPPVLEWQWRSPPGTRFARSRSCRPPHRRRGGRPGPGAAGHPQPARQGLRPPPRRRPGARRADRARPGNDRAARPGLHPARHRGPDRAPWLLALCQPLDDGQGTPAVPAQRKVRREYENRVSALARELVAMLPSSVTTLAQACLPDPRAAAGCAAQSQRNRCGLSLNSR